MIVVHTPIMVPEIISFFNLTSSSYVADLTTGEGGHSCSIAQLNPQGGLLCLDRDAQILKKAQERLKEYSHIRFICDTYDHISTVRQDCEFPLFNAILVDMGVSMFHFKEAKRGFSFEDESLDMRLDESDMSAEDVLNTYPESEIADIFYYYGEEHASRKLARAVVKNRPLRSAKELADLCLKVMGRKGKTHPATKIFQALRIYVNKELEIAEKFLEECVQNLASGGVLCILSFHSMEDRLIKKSFKEFVSQGLGTLPLSKALAPSLEEQRLNPASRSAKLRIFQRS